MARLLMTGLVLTMIAQLGIVVRTVAYAANLNDFSPIEVAETGKPEPGRTRGNDGDRRVPSRW
jgi:hypothetical protein